MPKRKTLIAVLAAAVVAALVPLLHAGRAFTVTGVVRAPLADGRLIVAHDDIAGFMPAMTMAFEVPESARAAAAALKPGQRIEFALDVDESHAWASRFRGVGATTEAAPAPVGAAAPVRRVRAGDGMPVFSLQDENGRSLTNEALVGRATLVTFIFTRCPVPEFCPLIARRFGELQRAIVADAALKERVWLLAITLDPAFDRPAVLKEYGRAVGADPAVWNFGTGDEQDVTPLVKAFSVYTERDGVTLNHTLCTALVGPDGRIVELWRGNGWTNEEVLAAMRKASR